MSSIVAARIAAHATPRAGATAPQARTLRGNAPRRGARLEIVALVVIAVLLVLGACNTVAHSSHAVALTRVRVEAGQTVWALAVAHPVPGQSTSETARLIAERNALRDGALVAGSVIVVPRNAEWAAETNLAMR